MINIIYILLLSLFLQYKPVETLSCRVSMYTATTRECGPPPFKTANGSLIKDPMNASQLRWCAVSKDLPFRYGDSIYVECKQQYYKVVDRCGIPNTIDILESVGTKPYLYSKCTVTKK